MKWNSDLKLTRDFLQENWKWIVAKLPVADGKDWESERRQTRGLNKYLPYSHVSAVQCAVPRPPQSQTPGFWQLPEVIHPLQDWMSGALFVLHVGKISEVKIDWKSFHSFPFLLFFFFIFQWFSKKKCSDIHIHHRYIKILIMSIIKYLCRYFISNCEFTNQVLFSGVFLKKSIIYG